MQSTLTVYGYAAYLVISIGLTYWVARTLRRNGQVFLIDAFRGNEKLATAVNELLVVGFYLINVGYVTLAMRFGARPHVVADMLETLSTKVGMVLVVLGIMHFFNMFVFSRMRRRALAPAPAPPVRPDEVLAPARR